MKKKKGYVYKGHPNIRSEDQSGPEDEERGKANFFLCEHKGNHKVDQERPQG